MSRDKKQSTAGLILAAASGAIVSVGTLPMALALNAGIYCALLGHAAASWLVVRYRVGRLNTSTTHRWRQVFLTLIYLSFVAAVALGLLSELVNLHARAVHSGPPLWHAANDIAFVLFVVQLVALRRWMDSAEPRPFTDQSGDIS